MGEFVSGMMPAQNLLTDLFTCRYELAITFNPSCVEAYNNLGVILREQGNVERALACYQAALQLRPNFPQGLNNLAVVLTAQVRLASWFGRQ